MCFLSIIGRSCYPHLATAYTRMIDNARLFFDKCISYILPRGEEDNAIRKNTGASSMAFAFIEPYSRICYNKKEESIHGRKSFLGIPLQKKNGKKRCGLSVPRSKTQNQGVLYRIIVGHAKNCESPVHPILINLVCVYVLRGETSL